MKFKNLYRISLLLVITFVAVSLQSCKDDNEPANSGEARYDSLVGQLFDNDGLPAFSQTPNGYYYYLVNSEEEAVEYCDNLIGEKISGKDYTCLLPGDYGKIVIVKYDDNGIFYNIVVKLKDKPEFIISICHPAALEDENAFQISTGEAFDVA